MNAVPVMGHCANHSASDQQRSRIRRHNIASVLTIMCKQNSKIINLTYSRSPMLKQMCMCCPAVALMPLPINHRGVGLSAVALSGVQDGEIVRSTIYNRIVRRNLIYAGLLIRCCASARLWLRFFASISPREQQRSHYSTSERQRYLGFVLALTATNR